MQEKPVQPYRWFLGTVTIIVLAMGWKVPQFGFLVPVAMGAGIVGAFFRGRWVCGNLCPRGSFFDTFFRRAGRNRPVPPLLRSAGFRWGMATLLMGAVAAQIAANPGDPLHWGFVFWTACTVTTAVAVILGILYSPRAWCAICPVGTIAASIGGTRRALEVDSSCKGCGLCEQLCPMKLPIRRYKGTRFEERDCIRCSTCIIACPAGALQWPETVQLSKPEASAVKCRSVSSCRD